MKILSASSIRLFLLLCVFRVLNTFLIRSYFDPDEFWQTMEPAYCAVFRPEQEFDCPGFTWEWKRRGTKRQQGAEAANVGNDLISQSLWGPARTYLSVLPTDLFFRVLQAVGLDESNWWVARGPMLLYAITVAAPTDWMVWYCANIMYASSSPIPAWCLFASLTAWFNAYSMVRTLANAQEAFLLVLSACLVAPELLGNVVVKSNKSNTHSYYWRHRLAFLVGGMSVSIRGTSVAAYVPMGILLAWRGEPTVFSRIAYLFSTCALYGGLGIGMAAAVDYWFFGFVTLPFLGNFHFNVILDYACLYGSHPWHWYLTSGIAAVTGILLPFLVADLLTLHRGQWSRGRCNLWIILAIYVWAVSMNAHKEFRYILPVLPICCLLAGEQLQRAMGRQGSGFVRIFLLAVFIVGNLIAVLYLGQFHQSGPVSVNRTILRLASATKPMDGIAPAVHHVHYWTGSCHSTPLLSALHSPSVRFETRTLDCSPSCRADPDAVCEYEQFHRDPLSFLQGVYPEASCNAEDSDENGKTCRNEVIALPSFVVTRSNYVEQVRDYLGQLGLHEIERYPNNINGLRIGEFTLGDEFQDASNGRIRLFGYLDISVEEIVLFANESPLHVRS